MKNPTQRAKARHGVHCALYDAIELGMAIAALKIFMQIQCDCSVTLCDDLQVTRYTCDEKGSDGDGM